MQQLKRKREIIPPWKMPSDPVKAVFWFMHWSLQVLVRFFWIPMIGMGIWETYLSWRAGGPSNGLVAGFITLLIGVVVWAALYGVLLFLNISASISQFISDVSRVQQDRKERPSFSPFADSEAERNVVEGTITDLEEERLKRRQQ